MRIACLLTLSINGCAWLLGAEPGKLEETSDSGVHELCPGTPDAGGVFVAAGGKDSPACGAAASPCATIQTGIVAAKRDGKSSVFVARGNYVDAITLAAGVAIRGGFEWQGGRWGATCDPIARSIVTVRAPSAANVTVLATSLMGSARLVTLTVLAKEEASSSESVYGLMAIGADTEVALDDVEIITGNAGDGSAGAEGTASMKGGSGCPAGSGSAGSPGSPGAGAPGGTFSRDGYTPRSGANGGSGSNGQNGTVGSAPTCVNCVSCNILQSCTSAAGTSCGVAGKVGCAGTGGGGGVGGSGGGSAVGLFVWDAIVSVHAGAIRTGNGGRGGNGGAGGVGAAGGDAIAGADGMTCATGCDAVLCTANSYDHGRGGGKGIAGGSGGSGGAGGGGAGGFSYAIVTGGSAAVDVSEALLVHGQPGAGGNGAASGAAGDRFP